MGTESEYAVATPGNAFSAPGPYCIANTPSRRPFVVRLKPSAMPTPTRSWRQSTGRIPAAAAASITGVVGYVLRSSTPSSFMISASASTTFIPSLLCVAHGLLAELLGDEVPAERGVVRGAVRVAVIALDRLGVHHGARAAALEEAVDGADAEARDEGLVAAVADPIELAEPFAARGAVEDLADVLTVKGPGRVDFRRGLGQPELQGHRIRGPARAGHALGARHELVDGALRDADQRRGQIPSRQAPERRAVAETAVELEARHVVDAAALGIDGPVGRHEGGLDHNVLAAAAPHTRREPRVDDMVVRAREQEPQGLVGARAGHGHHDPGRRVTAAREAPAPRHPEPAARRLDLAAGRVQAAREERVGAGREEFVLAALGEVAEPPVVRRPERVAPRGRAAAAPELPPDLERGIDLDVVAAVATRIADPDQAGGEQVLHALRQHLPGLFRARRALLEDRDERSGPAEQLVPGEGLVGDPGGGSRWAHGAPMLRRAGLRTRARGPWPGIASGASRGGTPRRSARESRARRPGAR